VRKIIFAFILILTGFVLTYLLLKKQPGKSVEIRKNDLTLNKSVSPTEKALNPGSSSENLKDSSYKISWIIIRDIKKISLFSNLEDKLSSQEAREKNFCDQIVSGSFYSDDSGHIGLFVSDGIKLKNFQENKTFNGFFFIDDKNTPYISFSEPKNPKIAIQVGPILFIDKHPIPLKIAKDENARRIIAAVTENKEVVFIAIYNSSNTFEGPTLAELPAIIEDINRNTALDIKDAINLDGGSHSTFISNTIKLSEISPIGSYFCIKP